MNSPSLLTTLAIGITYILAPGNHALAEVASPIRVGVLESAVASGDAGSLGVTLNVLFEELVNENFGEATIFASDSSFINAVQKDEIDFFPLETFQYFRFRERAPLKPALTAIIDESCFETLIVLGKKGSQHASIADYASKDVTITHQWTTPYGQIWMDHLLDKNGLPSSEEYFKQVSTVKQSQNAILSVFFGKQDLCIATKRSFEAMAELNPQIRKSLQVVAESDPLLLFCLCASGNRSAEERLDIIRRASSTHEHPAGKQILTLSKVERLQPFEEGQLDTMKVLWNFHQERHSKSEYTTAPLE